MDNLISNLEFLFVIKKLQTTYRFPKQPDGRQENDAEHSWMVAITCLLALPYLEKEFKKKLNREKILSMALIHDLAETVTGDTKTWDDKARVNKEEKERMAINQLFSKLPKKSEKYYLELWEECEKQESLEAKIVKSIDRMDPVIHRIFTGAGWHEVDEWNSGVANLDERQIPRHQFSKELLGLYRELRKMAVERKMFLKRLVK
jgi:putative hydrolase of HD superfamily